MFACQLWSSSSGLQHCACHYWLNLTKYHKLVLKIASFRVAWSLGACCWLIPMRRLWQKMKNLSCRLPGLDLIPCGSKNRFVLTCCLLLQNENFLTGGNFFMLLINITASTFTILNELLFGDNCFLELRRGFAYFSPYSAICTLQFSAYKFIYSVVEYCFQFVYSGQGRVFLNLNCV